MKESKIIEYGKVNDTKVYAMYGSTTGYLEPISKMDLIYVTPDVIIKCDKGVYPSVTSFEQYICNQVNRELYPEDFE